MTARKPLTLTLEEQSHQWCQLMAGTIIRARRERRWSQRQLGAKVGLSQSQISVLESDPDAMHVGRLYGTLRALGIDLVMQPLSPADAQLVRRRRSDRLAVRETSAANDQTGALGPAA
jgi:transcriptional regulator with XRE-family HTH domain